MLHLPDTGTIIKFIGIAEAPGFSFNLIQEGVSKRCKVKPRVHYEIYHYSE